MDRNAPTTAAAKDAARMAARSPPQRLTMTSCWNRPEKRLGADAEIGAMAEGMQPDISKKQIEPEREDQPDRHLDAQILVKPDCRKPERAVASATMNRPNAGVMGDPPRAGISLSVIMRML